MSPVEGNRRVFSCLRAQESRPGEGQALEKNRREPKKVRGKMGEENKQIPPPQFDLDAKWDACLDLGLRRFAYSSFAGAFGGLLLFRSPVTRWASVAFGAGVGIGSAYTECSYIFNKHPAKLVAPAVSNNPVSPDEQNRDES
ncbi:uncharacterized protein LOC127808980 [Diospyros lotus]|uniref:uncharacterized protein LOC127808980 n=1 Tax=Diospyros lotus TaxID=55363 RepID=UPI00224ECC20|nr:uncharacterized protein LOC127808980 [Diospyros lotus]